MRVETLADGTTVRELSPIKGVPFYSDWLRYLLSVDAAHTYTDGEIDKMTGMLKQKIRPLDRQQEQRCRLIDGEARVICLACGTPSVLMEMNKIRIGGLVQMKHEDETGPHEVTKRYKVQPLSRQGLGCRACQERYRQVSIEVERDNKERASLSLAKAALELDRARLQGRNPVEAKMFSLRTAFIDIFER